MNPRVPRFLATADEPASFFNRERELAQLETTWTAGGAQLVTLWGRRRVGKSTLLFRFAAGKRAVYLYGTRMAERDILAGLALQAADVFDDPYVRSAPFPCNDTYQPAAPLSGRTSSQVLW